MQKTSVFPDFYCLPNKLALMGRSPGYRDEHDQSRQGRLKTLQPIQPPLTGLVRLIVITQDCVLG
jgi:hypothetical protein